MKPVLTGIALAALALGASLAAQQPAAPPPPDAPQQNPPPRRGGPPPFGRGQFGRGPRGGPGPDGLGLMVVPDRNPLTPEKIDRGRALFFNAQLSADGTTSCATCHEPTRA